MRESSWDLADINMKRPSAFSWRLLLLAKDRQPAAAAAQWHDFPITSLKLFDMETRRVSKKFYVDWFAVAPGVWGIKDIFVNMYLIHNTSNNTWVLVDAGLKTSAAKIKTVAEHLFWPEHSPSAIVLTHAHFDHVGSLKSLAEEWNVPIYAHRLEEPFLTGRSSYPPPDPTAGGGLMTLMSCLYPKGPINVGERLNILPEDGSIPVLPEWRYIHTPGHAPGHISLFRQRDGVLIAGDAVVSTCQESAISVMLQKKELHGPPKYFTYNWISAADSVKRLAALKPQIMATGHGPIMEGEELRTSIHNLSERFRELAVPAHGRYSDDPALINQDGIQYLPPSRVTGFVAKAVGITAAVVLGIFLARKKLQRRSSFSFSGN